MMTKSTLCKLTAGIGLSMFLLTACVDDKNLDLPPVSNQSFTEEFDTVTMSLNRGWRVSNTSVPKGPDVWQQGGAPVPWFPAYSSNGSYAGFIGADYTSTTFGTISNWLISPVITMKNGDKIIFYTRSLEDSVRTASGAATGDLTDYGNRLQVRVSTNGDTYSTGSGIGTGDFKTLILDINPNLLMSSRFTPMPNAYPTTWTRFEATIFGLEKPVRGRFSFRYFMQDAGLDPSGGSAYGNAVGIDKVTYQSAGY